MMNPAMDVAGPRRSRQGIEFEKFWRKLPRESFLPRRRDFNPARAAAFLPNLMLLEIHLGVGVSFPIRLVGSAVQDRIQRDIKGHDYLDLMAEEHRRAAVSSAKLMLSQPCGLWQVTPFHYRRGLAQNIEITAFPFVSDAMPLLLGLMIPRDELVQPVPMGSQSVLAGTAIEFQFLDVGAGRPEWPQ